MSFTVDIIDELVALEYEKTCCRKALLFGLFFGAERVEKKLVLAEFKTESGAKLAFDVLKRQFSAEPELFSVVRAGKKFFCVKVNSKPIANYIDEIGVEEQAEENIQPIMPIYAVTVYVKFGNAVVGRDFSCLLNKGFKIRLCGRRKIAICYDQKGDNRNCGKQP